MINGATIDIGVGGLLLYGIPFIIVVGWFSGRILGGRRGWGRALVAGIIGWICGVWLAPAVQGATSTSTSELNELLVLPFFFRVQITMFVSLTLEIILKPRVWKRRRFGPILHPIATLKRKLAPLGRSREILGYARKRGVTG